MIISTRLPIGMFLIFTVLLGGAANSASAIGEHGAALNAEMAKQQPDRESVLLFLELGIVEFTVSENGSYAGITAVEHGGQPRSLIYEAVSGDFIDISRGNGIEFDLFVADDKSYVYSVHEYSVSVSYLVSDLGEVGRRQGLYRKSLIRDGLLFAHFFDVREDRNYLFIYDAKQEGETYVEIDFYVDTISLTDEGILLEGVPTLGDGRVTYLYAMREEVLRQFALPEGGPCFVSSDRRRVAQEPVCIEDTLDRLEYLVGQELWSHDPARSFACSGNDLGRLSWHAAYELSALVTYSEYVDSEYPLFEVVSNAMDCLLRSARFDADETFGWPTKKYSTDRESSLSLMVNNATIIHAMLAVVRSGILSEASGDEVVALARELHDRYQNDYVGEESGYYRFPRGVPFHLDGVAKPYNQQNAYGLALLELYEITGDETFRQRAESLARWFRDGWEFDEGGAALWHYWPPMVRQGWSVEDNISDNTPSWEARTDALYEDISHAGLNVEFVIEMYRRLPNSPFSKRDIDSLERTLKKFRLGEIYSAYISGDTEFRSPSRRFMPKFGGWLKIADSRLVHEVSLGLPVIVPYFDMGGLPAYLAILDRAHQLSGR